MTQEYREKIETEQGISAVMNCLLWKVLVPCCYRTREQNLLFENKGRLLLLLGQGYCWWWQERECGSVTTSIPRNFEISKKKMQPTHPIRWSLIHLVLNFFMFYFNILNSPDNSCSLVKSALDEAIAEPDSLNEELYKDRMLRVPIIGRQLDIVDISYSRRWSWNRRKRGKLTDLPTFVCLI